MLAILNLFLETIFKVLSFQPLTSSVKILTKQLLDNRPSSMLTAKKFGSEYRQTKDFRLGFMLINILPQLKIFYLT